MSKINEVNQSSISNTRYDAHSSSLHNYFSLAEMEFNFKWITGSISTGGCELGEAFDIAKLIEDNEQDPKLKGTPESWQREWENIARRKEKMASQFVKCGNKVSACSAYLIASNYYRAALISMLPYMKDHLEVKNDKYFEIGAKYMECFKEAAKRFESPAEFFEVDLKLENSEELAPVPMPGYFVKPDKSEKQRPTLLMIGGGESFKEELYFYIAPFALRRGYNFLTVDLPGQGFMPTHGQIFRKDTEVQISAILDKALELYPNAIDPDKIMAFGISNGGYFVPRAATVERRIRALAVSNAIIDNEKMFKEMPFANATKSDIKKWHPFRYNVSAGKAYRWGVGSDLAAQVYATKGFTYDPSLIKCPCLVLLSCEKLDGEAERQQYEFLEKISRNKTDDEKKFDKMIISDNEIGTISHCFAENRSYMAQVLFDWFDDVLKDKEK